MELHISTILEQNITIVYDSLDPNSIDNREVKKLLGDTPMVAEMPDMTFVINPKGPTLIQMGDRRVRISHQGKSNDLVPLWEIATGVNELIEDSTLISYGFNYKIGITLDEGDAYQSSIDLFLNNPNQIQDIVGGELNSFVPRFKFQRNQVAYDLILEPIEEQRIIGHLNAHRQYKGIALPPSEGLRLEFSEEYNLFISYIPNILTK